jgi:hypothetical protein
MSGKVTRQVVTATVERTIAKNATLFIERIACFSSMAALAA